MDKFLENIFISLDSLYYLYEKYIWKNKNSNLDVLIQDNTISFYLYKEKEVIDEIILSFEDKERNIYKYICIRLLILLLGNVYIHNYENIFYNDRHKSYLRLIVNDEEIKDMMNIVINMQDTISINENIDYIINIKKNLTRKRYSNDFIETLNDRINFSKKLLKKV